MANVDLGGVVVEERRKAEVARLLDDSRWRMNNLYAIEPKQGGVVKFRFNSVQESWWAGMWWLNVVLKSRQHGMSTVINLHQLDTCLFNGNVTCGVVDKTREDATKKLNKVKLAYSNLDSPEVHPDTCGLGAALKEAVRITKSNESEIEFSNGSKIWCGTSLRGGTVQYLHISELGPIAFKFPDRAKEIRSGAFNTVHAGCKIAIESTHEGGKGGLNYEMVRLAQRSPEKLSPLHWKLHFFAWFEDADNSQGVDSGYEYAMTPEVEEIFSVKSRLLGREFTKGQKYWYALKYATQKEDMSKEHPFDVEEALSASVTGSIYGKELGKLRQARRVLDFELDSTSPLYTFWDLGSTDYTWIVLMQFHGLDWYVYDTFAWHGAGARFYYAKVVEWERRHGPITMNYMPHDGQHDKKGAGSSWIADFKACGMRSVRAVPVTPDKWIGIKHLRSQMPRCYIHETNCSKEFEVGKEVKIPSLISCFEGYHTKLDERNGMLKEVPAHDQFSHAMDAMRTFAEAHKKGMLDDGTRFGRESSGRGPVVDRGRYGGRGVSVSRARYSGGVVRY